MVNIMKYYYARVSTTKQNLSRQVELFKELGGTIRTIFEEKNQEQILKIEKPGKN